jgi:small subunit ribosomal protein S19e
MTSVYEAEPKKFLSKLAGELKKLDEFKMPEWSLYVKTSTARARPPIENDFWYTRAGSILRQIYFRGVIGVNRLKTKYGGRKKRGVKPAEFRKAGGKIIRVILQQAEKAGLVEKSKSKKAGRQLTKKGKEFLDKIAGESK